MTSAVSENTTNRVYIASEEFGWLPAKVISTSGTCATVQVKDYEQDLQIPACEVSNIAATTLKRHEKIAIKELKVDLSSKTYSDGVLPLQNVDQDGKLVQVEDMVDLGFLHEAAILYNLKARHSQGIPYTRTGDIVIAVNPYRWIDELYTEEMRNFYAEKLVWDSGEFWI
jgi:myosin-5